jgi:hypothetical protein
MLDRKRMHPKQILFSGKHGDCGLSLLPKSEGGQQQKEVRVRHGAWSESCILCICRAMVHKEGMFLKMEDCVYWDIPVLKMLCLIALFSC